MPMTMMMQTSSKSSLHPPGRSNVVTATALGAARINEFSILDFHNPLYNKIVDNSTVC